MTAYVMKKDSPVDLRQAEEQGLSYADFLGQVLQREIHQREENQQRLKIRKAKFPLEKSLDTL
jgi:DNA replication protein DnaC